MDSVLIGVPEVIYAGGLIELSLLILAVFSTINPYYIRLDPNAGPFIVIIVIKLLKMVEFVYVSVNVVYD